jgi:segregation and condensation protein A
VNEPDANPEDLRWSRDAALPDRAACAVKLPVFEGPLDLLLHLIRENQVDIADIPIALIADQYLAYLDLWRLLDIDVAAEYLVMAATLAHLKSRMLLPPSEGEDEEEGEDPRAELARRLAEYAVFKDAALQLDSHPLLGRDVFAGTPLAQESEPRERELSVSLLELVEALRRALSRLPPEEVHHQINLERVTLQERMVAVMDRLRAAAADAALLFEDLLVDAARTRNLIAMTFLSILELARIQAVLLFQNARESGEPFGPIRVRLAVSRAAEESEHG